MKEFINSLLSNYMLMAAVTGWLAAQLIKTILYAYLNHDFRLERMIGSGGMPSSHSSTVVALTTACAFTRGVASPLFAICTIFAIVVMHDAAGVRLETGKQAVILNKILLENPFDWKGEEFEKKLKEYVGHTPLQVLMGAILGFVTALVVGAFF